MGDKSAIEWTEATWNPTTGCTKVSPGCAHCYAETLSLRFGWSKKPWIPAYEAENVVLHPERLDAPLQWRKKPRRVFVDSMSDMFHENVPDDFIDRVFAVMALSPQHTYQVLTKRPERMRKYVGNKDVAHRITSTLYVVEPRPTDMDIHFAKQGRTGGNETGMLRWPLENLWLGVSVENQRWADQRIPILLDTPAAVRFISAEPLLGPIDLAQAQNRFGSHELIHNHSGHPDSHEGYLDVHWHENGVIRGSSSSLQDARFPKTASVGNPWEPHHHHNTTCDFRLDWVIVGGESGPKHRPFDPAWARSIVAQCRDAGVACFVKQLGGFRPGNKIEELPEDLRVREFPT